MDRKATRAVGLEGKEASRTGLGEEMARGKQKARPDHTTRHRSREPPGSSRRLTSNKTSASAPRRAPESRECTTHPSPDRTDRTC
jgi:hypothetical protein